MPHSPETQLAARPRPALVACGLARYAWSQARAEPGSPTAVSAIVSKVFAATTGGQFPPYGAKKGQRLAMMWCASPARPSSALLTNHSAAEETSGTHCPNVPAVLWALIPGSVDAEPCAYGYPTSRWGRGEFVTDRLSMAIPGDAPPGGHQPAMGFYEWPTLKRLPISRTGRQAAADEVVTLGKIEVADP